MYIFEGKYVDNKIYFRLEFDWIETNFNTIEPEFYKIFFNLML